MQKCEEGSRCGNIRYRSTRLQLKFLTNYVDAHANYISNCLYAQKSRKPVFKVGRRSQLAGELLFRNERTLCCQKNTKKWKYSNTTDEAIGQTPSENEKK
jgi:hypothetical protein